MLQTVVTQLSQQPHAVINLSLALLLLLSAWYLIGKHKIPCTIRHTGMATSCSLLLLLASAYKSNFPHLLAVEYSMFEHSISLTH